MSKTTHAIKYREDLSQFIIHLTRDTGNKSARENLISILGTKTILACNPHSMFSPLIDRLNYTEKQQLNVACFTEIPLHQLHLLVREIQGRQIKLKPYGLVFKKEFILQKGGHPVLYINSYFGNLTVNEAMKRLFLPFFREKSYRFTEEVRAIMPFLSIMNEQYDFSWEREWRVLGNFEFEHKDIAALVLPSTGEEHIKQAASEAGVAVISPGLTYEEIVYQLILQQRETRFLTEKNLKQFAEP
ncbi:Protein of unknown function (DUF2743) [Beggiatoa alba B18LD]|uniref:Uncharacterized protein n=1 Tax=Beggiatoa alba B18LD TaxID=395493 RepID=I3CEA3_9GAMM|nr:DUF2743 domain-containing protein [Beggiatoa alba]EIJ41946.1 Protein of unknown function (DUF2743) [Beggiatoa alba B18LD]